MYFFNFTMFSNKKIIKELIISNVILDKKLEDGFIFNKQNAIKLDLIPE